MRAFWNDCGTGPAPDEAREVDRREACLIWSDEVRGVEGNFLGLIDDRDRTIQFYYEAGIPDEADDAGHLRIVLMDLPQAARNGSYQRRVAIGEVHRLIEAVFEDGADPHRFGGLFFAAW
ncbi:MAG: hypothetical protein PGN34_17785 [Methylobacterium frigidaeris]